MKEPTMDEWAEKLGTIALNGFEYNGRTLREWIDLMASGYCVILPNGATNGDVIKALFPDIEIADSPCLDKVYTGIMFGKYIGVNIDCMRDWWSAPYNRGDKDESSINHYQ